MAVLAWHTLFRLRIVAFLTGLAVSIPVLIGGTGLASLNHLGAGFTGVLAGVEEVAINALALAADGVLLEVAGGIAGVADGRGLAGNAADDPRTGVVLEEGALGEGKGSDEKERDEEC